MEKELNERKQLEIEKRKLLRELRELQNEGAIPEDEESSTIMELESENLEKFEKLQPESPQKLIKSEPEDIDFGLRTPEDSNRMLTEEDNVEEMSLRKGEKKSRRKWTKEKKTESRIKEGEVPVPSRKASDNLKSSPTRIQGYRTPAKEGSAIVLKSLASDAKGTLKKNKWAQKKIEEREDEDDWLNIVKERMPIDILVQICVANVIEEQTRLVIYSL